jgi:type IV pilus assembly protein PilW
MNNQYPAELHSNFRGFTLVELMVALVITLILLAGIGQIFLSSKKSFNIQESLSRMQENGRYAIEMLAQDIRRAGYWGGNADVESIKGTEIASDSTIINDPGSCSATDTNWALRLSHDVFGKNDNKGSYACLDPYPYVAGGDILVLRYASPWVVGGTSLPLDCSGATIKDCYPNKYFLRSSLFKGRLFQGTDEDNPSNTLIAPAVKTSELISRIYFVGTSGASSKCPASGTVKSLNRLILNSAGATESEVVANGVEDMQVRYGVMDMDTTVVPPVPILRYYDAADSLEWDKVIAVRVWLLMRSECGDTGYTNDTVYPMPDPLGKMPYNDSYRRQLYTTTVQLRNH